MMKTRFIKTEFGWAAYMRHGHAYVYVGHFYTQREARAALAKANVYRTGE